jgi:hypothetical protein
LILRALLFLLIGFQVACGQNTRQTNKRKPFAFVDSLLSKDSYTIEFLDFEYPKDLQEIVLRFQQSTVDRKEWFEDYYSKNFKQGEGLPYHENLGITKEEYQKIKDIEKMPPTIVVKSTAFVKANRNSNVFSFKTSENDIKFLETLKIDFRNEVLIFLNDTIPFSSEINAPVTTPFGEWHGYSWKKEISSQGENDVLRFDSLSATIMEVDFGKIKKNNKTLLRLKYNKINKGSVKAKLDLACYLN